MRKKMMPDYSGNLDEYRKSLNVIASRETTKAVSVAKETIRRADEEWEKHKMNNPEIGTLDNPEALVALATRMRKIVKRNPDPKNTKVKGLKRNV